MRNEIKILLTMALAMFLISCGPDTEPELRADVPVYVPSSDSNPGNSSSSSVNIGCPNAVTDNSNNTMTCGGQTYATVEIGEQTWMAENLNYNAAGSVCYSNSETNCATYGRLYNWSTAMALSSTCNSTSCSSQVSAKHQGVCPEGWHIPTNAEWDKLYRYVDGTNGTSSPYDSPTAGRYLKATSGWNSSGNGQDTYGFSALPGGYGYSGGLFFNVGNYGYWWSASENDSNYAYSRYMGYYNEDAYYNYDGKDYLFSVRCLQD
jgi:uncharacterized protein (TIGR02145 family)